MTFLAPAILATLPLAALPLIIHLVHLHRRRRVPWAAMMFLRTAQRMNKGYSRLRQVLILLLRFLAVAATIFVVTRPLAGGWLGLTGGAPDVVLILLDRSASMEQQNPATGLSKRAAGLRALRGAIHNGVGTRSRLVLIDSALEKPIELGGAEALEDLPQCDATDTAADMPGLLQCALDYLAAHRVGSADIWLLSDLQASSWNAASGRWSGLRRVFAGMRGVRFHLLCYPQIPLTDLGVSVDRVVRSATADNAEVVLDLRIWRSGSEHPASADVPLRFVVGGVATAAKVTLNGNQLSLPGYRLPVDRSVKRGWGRVELPADENPANNVANFVLDEQPELRSVIVSDDDAQARPLLAALCVPADTDSRCSATILPSSRADEIDWAATALVVWQAPVPPPTEILARRLREHVQAGRTVLFLPPELPNSAEFLGLRWDRWITASKPESVEWWRNDAGLLANTQDGAALPVGMLELSRRCGITGTAVSLARVAGQQPLLLRVTDERGGAGSAYFLGTLPGSGYSSLARDGVVMFALLHRALAEAAAAVSITQTRAASADALGVDPGLWHPVAYASGPSMSAELPLRAGIVACGDRLVALNRPSAEDLAAVLKPAEISDLFAGLDFRLVTETLQDGHPLTSEIWRTFLLAVAACLLGEALLCLPPKRAVVVPGGALAAGRPASAV